MAKTNVLGYHEVEENLMKWTSESVPAGEIGYQILKSFGKSDKDIERYKSGKGVVSSFDGLLIKNLFAYKKTDSVHLRECLEEMKADSLIIKNSPKIITVSDGEILIAYDTREEDTYENELAKLSFDFTFFYPLMGVERVQYIDESPADMKAAEKLAKLHDVLRAYNEFRTEDELHDLNIFIARLLFCFFAEDTGIFEEHLFTSAVENYTKPDGSDLKQFLNDAFNIMDVKERNQSTPKFILQFPYVNGGLFAKRIKIPEMSYKARQIIIACGKLNWKDINPDIFGSMIQSVVNPEQRANQGMHYTSVPNIMKVIQPLFLDELQAKYDELNGKYLNIKKVNDVQYKNCDIYNNDDGICIEKSAAGSFKLCHINDNKKRGVLIKNEASPMVENCEIYDHPNGGICLAENAQGIYSKCDIHDNEEQGVCIQDSAKGLFNECDIRDNKGNGLFVDGDSTPKIVKSKIHDNMVEDDSYPGIVVAENASPEFDECDVFNHASYGIWLQNQSQGVYSKCNIYGNEEEGAYIQDAAMGVFSECDVYDNKKQGIFITGKSSPKFEKCVVHDNVGDGKNDSGFCFREDSSPTIIGCEVYNQKIGVILADRANGECMKCNIHNNITGVGAVRSAAGVICESQIHHNNGNGFVIRGESSLKVKKCVVHDNNAEEKVCSGIVIKDDARPEISECEIYNHRGCGICENGIPRQGLNCNIHDNGEENLKN